MWVCTSKKSVNTCWIYRLRQTTLEGSIRKRQQQPGIVSLFVSLFLAFSLSFKWWAKQIARGAPRKTQTHHDAYDMYVTILKLNTYAHVCTDTVHSLSRRSWQVPRTYETQESCVWNADHLANESSTPPHLQYIHAIYTCMQVSQHVCVSSCKYVCTHLLSVMFLCMYVAVNACMDKWRYGCMCT